MEVKIGIGWETGGRGRPKELNQVNTSGIAVSAVNGSQALKGTHVVSYVSGDWRTAGDSNLV
jgi:hypothetical protein